MVSFSFRREFSHVLGEILRPVANLQVRAVRGHWFPALMYIDSGADMTLVPSDFGKLLGMDLTRDKELLAGVAGAPLRVSLQSAEVKIGSTVQRAKIAVALRNDVPYLLGREGLFKAFRITFEEYLGRTSFTRQSKVEETLKRLKTGSGELKKHQYKVASSREGIDRILSS